MLYVVSSSSKKYLGTDLIVTCSLGPGENGGKDCTGA